MRQNAMKGDGSLLIVDDEKDIRAALRRLLHQMGCAAQESADGQEALDLLRGGYRPSVILLDQDMPVMTGPQLLRALRAEPAWACIPVIRMSGRDWSDDSSPLLTKPFELQQLADLLAEILPESMTRVS